VTDLKRSIFDSETKWRASNLESDNEYVELDREALIFYIDATIESGGAHLGRRIGKIYKKFNSEYHFGTVRAFSKGRYVSRSCSTILLRVICIFLMLKSGYILRKITTLKL
jgi:hypothetical protein